MNLRGGPRTDAGTNVARQKELPIYGRIVLICKFCRGMIASGRWVPFGFMIVKNHHPKNGVPYVEKRPLGGAVELHLEGHPKRKCALQVLLLLLV